MNVLGHLNTTYLSSAYATTDNYGDVGNRIKDMVFEEEVHQSKTSEIFRVLLDGKKFILKVYHRDRKYSDVHDRETDPYKCESQAYRKLLAGGVCDQGIVPWFYGDCSAVDVQEALPHLAGFLKDDCPAGAVLMEYIPDLEMIDLPTITDARTQRLESALDHIHKMGVLHFDLKLRHMMLQPSSDRIVLIDFDYAQNFPPDRIPSCWEKKFSMEKEVLKCYLDALLECAKTGKPAQSWIYS